MSDEQPKPPVPLRQWSVRDLLWHQPKKHTIVQTCAACGGTGVRSSDPCEFCGGTGRTRR